MRTPVRIGIVAAAVGILAAVLPPALASNDPYRNQQWALSKVGAEQGWTRATGAGVTIAIVDTGVDLQHEDLKANLTGGLNLIEDGQPPQDDNGHGTHVAGIAAAVANNGKGVAGVAPRARIMPIRVLEDNGSGSAGGSIEDIAAGVEWAVDHGAKVVNLSLSENVLLRGLTGGFLQEAVEYAWNKGAVAVVTAGNQGDGLFGSGYRDVKALVVSATTDKDTKPSYATGVGSATWGIAAPGGVGGNAEAGNVVSTYWMSNSANRYAYLAGSSMAAPHVAGAAALLMSRGLSNSQTVQRLLETAKDIGRSGRDSDFGSGRLDVAAAVAGFSTLAPRPAPKPAPAQPAPTSRARTSTSRPRTTSRTSMAPATPASTPLVITPVPTASDTPRPSAVAAPPIETRDDPTVPRAAAAGALAVAMITLGVAALRRRGPV